MPRLIKTVLSINLTLVIVIIFIFFGGLGIKSSKTVPSNALILLDDENRTYISPPCTTQYFKYRLSILSEARSLEYRPDPQCRDAGGFVQEGRSLSGMFLEKFGILKPLPSRWNENGNWNW